MNIELFIENIWMNRMGKGSEVKQHSHGGAFFSGCYYVKVPRGCPSINFYNPLDVLSLPTLPIRIFNESTSPCVKFHPIDGDILIWPSHLKHDVHKHLLEEERHIIAFDIKPTRV
jgi:uncharacterized protein (TIGR02466 family)